MGFIVAIILANVSIEVLASLSLYWHIPIKINTNRLWRSKGLIVIHRIDILLFNIKTLI